MLGFRLLFAAEIELRFGQFVVGEKRLFLDDFIVNQHCTAGKRLCLFRLIVRIVQQLPFGCFSNGFKQDFKRKNLSKNKNSKDSLLHDAQFDTSERKNRSTDGFQVRSTFCNFQFSSWNFASSTTESSASDKEKFTFRLPYGNKVSSLILKSNFLERTFHSHRDTTITWCKWETGKKNSNAMVKKIDIEEKKNDKYERKSFPCTTKNLHVFRSVSSLMDSFWACLHCVFLEVVVGVHCLQHFVDFPCLT